MSDIIEFGRFSVAPSPDNLQPRPDRRAIASVLPHESKMRVGELSQEGWRYEDAHEQVYPPSLLYSRAGRLAYVASEGGQQFVVAHGQAQGERWDAVSDELGWCEHGERYAFVGQRGGEVFVRASHGMWPVVGEPLPRRFAQSPDGLQVAWVAQADQQQRLFLNGEVVCQAPQIIENPVWSPSGHLAFAWAEERGVWVRVDGRDFGPYPTLNKGTPVWSPDSRRCGWVVQRKNKSVVVVDGEEAELLFSVVQGGTLAFSPDGNRWALAARTGLLNLKGCVVQDGKSGSVYSALGTTAPAWSPSGDALAYTAARGMRHPFVVCDGREGQRCSAFVDGSLTWHASGQVVGAIAKQEGQARVVLEERGGRSWSFGPPGGVMLRGDAVAFDDERSLHDLGIREDGVIFGWTANF